MGVEWTVGVVFVEVVESVGWSSVPVNWVVCAGSGFGGGCWRGVVVCDADISGSSVVGGRGVDLCGGMGAGDTWWEIAVRWGDGGVVHMVVGGVCGGGLVRCVGGCGVVGVSTVFRGCLLPSVSPSAYILAFGPARVCSPQVIQSNFGSLLSSYLLYL
jgi:hypothetical protein